MRSAPLFLCLIACGSGQSAVTDAGHRDTSVPDSALPDAHVADGGNDQQNEWSHCPSAESYAGDASWTVPLEVRADAIYCGTFDEVRADIREEWQHKAMLRVVPGTYRLPAAGSELAITLPLCVRTRTGHDATHGPGSVTRADANAELEIPLREEGTVVMQLRARESGVALNAASPAGDAKNEIADSFRVCTNPEECYGADSTGFQACAGGTTWSDGVHHLSMASGDIELTLRLGASFAGTEPGAFVRARGTFHSVTFDQSDYWHLVYHPAHHHFERAFGVLFDSPIDGICGFEVANVSPYEGHEAIRAYELDCELVRGNAIEVTGFELVRP